jgi:hypothetical protein
MTSLGLNEIFHGYSRPLVLRTTTVRAAPVPILASIGCVARRIAQV